MVLLYYFITTISIRAIEHTHTHTHGLFSQVTTIKHTNRLVNMLIFILSFVFVVGDLE